MQPVSKMQFFFPGINSQNDENKVWLKFFPSHQAQFPLLDLKKLLGHCQNKVHWSFNPSQTYCELSKTPDILQQLSEPCWFLAQNKQKIENPGWASFLQLLLLTVPCLLSTGREPAPCGDSTQHSQLLHQGASVPQSARDPHRHTSL